MESNLTIQPMLSCRAIRAATNENLLVIENIKPKMMEMVNIHSKNGKTIRGQIIQVSGNQAVAQVFEEIDGISLSEVRVECTGEVFKMPVSQDMIGGFFDGVGKPRDKAFISYPEKHMDIQGQPINPVSRMYPSGLITTGIGAIDLMNTISIGREYTIYSAGGLPHHELAAQIIRQASILGHISTEFTVVFAGIGLSNEAMRLFTSEFQQTRHQVTSFMNGTSDPFHERLLTPRIALTFAEYLAFEKQKYVMVVIRTYLDIADHNLVSKRQKYPAHLSSDLASLFERGGVVAGSRGSLTIVPIVTVPNDDMDHPIMDLMAAVTDNYLVLSRSLHNRGIYPPVDVMAIYRVPRGIGDGVTRKDHRAIVFQLYRLYAAAHEVNSLRAVLSESSIDESDQLLLEFMERFEEKIMSQSSNESRDLLRVLDVAWDLLRMFPRESLNYVPFLQLNEFYPKKVA